MEQDFIGLHQPVRASFGAELSSEDVSRLHCNVFHVPSNTGEAQAAMKKIVRGNDSWSCVGENIFDVLLQMEREKEQKEQLYWDLQLLNVGNLNRLCQMQQSTDPDSFPAAYNQSDSESSQSGQAETGGPQTRALEGREDLYRRAKRLKKASRQCWARLASEGVQTMVASPWQGGRPGVKVHAWGCVSVPDLLLLVEVKYDVVTHLLFTEMLQEHHTPSFWQTLLPWQQHKEQEGLEDLAEEVLVSGDMLHLAELPGAFRIYRACQGTCLSKSDEQSWSAMSFLYELHTCRQQERDALTVLGERLDRQSMRLLCSHIRLATLRAQRENTSHAALMAARQSWETWPHINSPCRTEQAVLWLQAEEANEDLTSVSPQQHSVLQLLVLSQEQERKHLVKLVHGLSLEDLQGEACTAPPKEESHQQAALRKGCINRLKEIHASQQTHSETRTPLEQADLARRPVAQPQTPAQMSRDPVIWSQRRVESCALLLLTHLLEFQEAQASALLSDLMDMNMQQLQVLQAKYECELQGQNCTNLLQLLVSDAPLTSGSILTPPSAVINRSSNNQTPTPKPQHCSDGPADTLQCNSVQAAEGTIGQDVCTGCGAVMEELPYLEILCVSETTLNGYQSAAEEKEAQVEEKGNTMRAQSYEKQGSLITLAWSKPPDGDADCEAEFADGGTGQSLDSESVVQTRVQSSDMSTSEHTQSDDTSGENYDEEAGEQQHSRDRQLTLEEGPVTDQPEKEEAVSACDLRTQTSQDEPPPPLFDLPEIKPLFHDLTPGLSSETTATGTDVDLVESSPSATQSDLWDMREPDPAYAEDQKYNSQTSAACGLAERDAVRESMLIEREHIREPVSAIERERTMRNLVHMQKKVEQRHQRDRERQLLRVQERLSIIQNKKAEKDLLGLKHMDRLKLLTQDLQQEDKQQQKTVVRERLEQLRRERSNLIQSKRNRNTAGFKELLGPVTLYRETEDTD